MSKKEDIVAASQASHVEDNAKGGEDFIEDSTPGLFLNLCVLATAIGGMLFGYDTGVISRVLVVLGDDLDGRLMSHGEKELITSLCAAGSLISAIIAPTRNEEGCVRYQLFQDKDNACHFVFQEQFKYCRLFYCLSLINTPQTCNIH